MRTRKLSLAALALAAGLALTACEGGKNAAGPGEEVNSSASEGSSTETEPTEGTATEPAQEPSSEPTQDQEPSSEPADGDGPDAAGLCKTANLDFRTSPGMGEGNLMVILRNTGDTCTFKGFPGVDLKTEAGTVSAERSDLPAPTVVVKTGEESRFTLHLPRDDSGGSGVDVTAIVVTPPDETHSKTLPVSLNIPVTDGGGRPVTVDPVGTGKQ
ncbi:DUF4232 domain-containing protein [Streptomyces cavernicola]|uniref:DUF4232 domain-containing protein n=1 Tax=Streptomyces cavernicola TaxID=3043613 RepID=A0ABT6SC31_9ACTN|nr:DUF4232 domain-containing protein [Streptomyces sp. B-S-A6]MDI3405755.1 DUF4232 domain-containing protein [Streptomyces sp. B-S-A6]